MKLIAWMDPAGSQVKHYFRLEGRAQGTTYAVVYAAPDSLLSSVELEKLFHEIDGSLSLYQPNSKISRFNAGEKNIRADRHLITVVRKSIEVYTKSSGLFDITVKPLVDMWGFGPVRKVTVPEQAEINKALERVGSKYLFIQENRLHSSREGLQIDCNGIAQGYTVDLIAELLIQKGVSDFLVELGGEIRVKGHNPERKPWQIGVEKPGSSDHSAYAAVQIISVDNGAVTSSGTYRNRHVVNGKNYSHIIDPRTGYPVNNGMVAATVIAADAMTADAWDNVLVLAGPERALKLLALYPGIEAYLVFTDSAGVMRDTATAGFGKYRVEVKEPAREHGYGDLQSHFPSGYPMSSLIFRR